MYLSIVHYLHVAIAKTQNKNEKKEWKEHDARHARCDVYNA